MDEVQKSLVRNIKKARKKFFYSQMKLAELCNLSTSFIAEIETGKKFPSSSTILKISKALGLKPFQLFVDDDSSQGWQRIDLITDFASELKKRLTSDIDSTVKKFIS